jgi:Ca2+-binding EF-hand superfamily protein
VYSTHTYKSYSLQNISGEKLHFLLAISQHHTQYHQTKIHMVRLTPHKDTKQQTQGKTNSGRTSGRTSYREGTVSSRNKSVDPQIGHLNELHMMKEKLKSEMVEAHKSDMDKMLEAAGFDADKLWEEQKKKSLKKHDKMTELMRAKQIFGALRDRHHSKHTNMFKAFQDMDLDYHDNNDGGGTLKFAPFYKALQGLYFDRLVSKQEAHEIFDLVDNDRSGAIDFGELQQAFDYATGSLGIATHPEQAKPPDARFTAVQGATSPKAAGATTSEASGDSGALTLKARTALTDAEMIEKKMANKRLNELKYRILDKVCQKNSRKSIREALRVAYKEADVNQDGNLSYEEFGDWLGNGPGGLGLGFTIKDVRDLTLACDKDLDGGIDSMEFINTISRRDRPDPRSFLNACREIEVSHMRKEKEREVERLRDRMINRRVKTPETNKGELSTRVWYTEDYDERAYVQPPPEPLSSRFSSSPTLLAPLKRTTSSPASLVLTHPTNMDSINLAPELQDETTTQPQTNSANSTSSQTSHNRRSLRRKRRDTNVFDSIQANLKQHVFQRTLNPGMVSRLNFEDFGKQLPSKRPEKGQKYKPVWANRLTFDRIGLGTGGIDMNSSMYATDRERLQEISSSILRTTTSVNPAMKFCGRELIESVSNLKAVRSGKREYLGNRKGQLRRRILQRNQDAESTDLSRIRSKTFQRLRFLESMQEVEEFAVRTSYNTKGLIKSPIAARNQAGSIMLFRPPSPRGRRNENLQTGIGQRAAAIVDWRF